jgi:hypothetical protein
LQVEVVGWVLLIKLLRLLLGCGAGSRGQPPCSSSNSRQLRLRWLQCSSSSSWLAVEVLA